MALTLQNELVRYVNDDSATESSISSKLGPSVACIVFGNIGGKVGIWLKRSGGTDVGAYFSYIEKYNKDLLAQYVYRALDQYVDGDIDSAGLTADSSGSLNITTSINTSAVKISEIKGRLP